MQFFHLEAGKHEANRMSTHGCQACDSLLALERKKREITKMSHSYWTLRNVAFFLACVCVYTNKCLFFYSEQNKTIFTTRQ